MERERYHGHPVMQRYYEILESAVPDYRWEIARLISQNPYFFLLHQEMLEVLEGKGDEYEYRSFLRFSARKFAELGSNAGLFHKNIRTWTVRDLEAARNVLARIRRAEPFWSRAALTGMFARLTLLRVKPVSFSLEDRGTNLSFMKRFDVTQLQEELERAEPWWSVETSRQERVVVQKETNSVYLRTIPGVATETPVPVDGPHESRRTPLAPFFPRVLNIAESFATERRGGLGRVAIVRLRPHMRVYRHYDPEVYTKGRNRYHAVLKSGGSLMSSGIERAVFREGELFFFDNQKMHVASNESDDWRVHLIFDMHEGARPDAG